MTLLNTDMNYLILTPDGVGSTILQRLITMTLYLEHDTVMNTHELTNGLKLQNNVAIKDYDLGYSQTLVEIANILQESQTETSLVSRLAKYHLENRKDSAQDCYEFYSFLNKHFEKKIMCVRENIFEYAMSWSIRDRSGVLNVYDEQDREKVLAVSEVDEKYFMHKCKEYVQYIDWMEQHFPNVEKISYEDTVKKSDQVMQRITGYANTFMDKFDKPLSYMLSTEHIFLKNKRQSDLSGDELRSLIRYRMSCKEMIERKKIIHNIPFKNTTLADKKRQIKNFNNCLDKFYNFAKNHNWIDQSKATYDFWNEQHLC